MHSFKVSNYWILGQLHGQKLVDNFYDGTPRTSLSPALAQLDAEIDELSAAFEQKAAHIYHRTEAFQWLEELDIQHFRRLLERHRRACEDFNASDPFYTYLPPEISSYVFELATTDELSEYQVPVPSRISSTLRLASVTRYWRQLVLVNPRLWTSFQLKPCQPENRNYDDDDDDADAVYVDQFLAFLERSGDVGLHIHLTIGDEWDGVQFDRLSTILRREARRMTSFRVDILKHTRMAAEYIYLLNFPILNANVVVYNAYSIFRLNDIHPTVSSPYLRADAMHGFRLYLPCLTFLELSGICLYQLRLILQDAPSLRTLKVRIAEISSLERVRLLVGANGSLQIHSDDDATTVQPCFHSGLESLFIDDPDALFTLTLPSLKTLCAWSDHNALPGFIQRSGCSLTRFGLDCEQNVGSLAGLGTVRELYIYGDMVDVCDRILRALMQRFDPASPNSLHFILVRVQSVVICIDSRHQRTSWDPMANDLFGILVGFRSTFGRSLGRLDVRVLPPGAVGSIKSWDESYDDTPEYCPIRINGHPLRHYLSVPWISPDARTIGQDRLNWVYRMIIIGLRIHAWLRDVPRLFRRLLTRVRRLLGREPREPPWPPSADAFPMDWPPMDWASS